MGDSKGDLQGEDNSQGFGGSLKFYEDFLDKVFAKSPKNSDISEQKSQSGVAEQEPDSTKTEGDNELPFEEQKPAALTRTTTRLHLKLDEQPASLKTVYKASTGETGKAITDIAKESPKPQIGGVSIDSFDVNNVLGFNKNFGHFLDLSHVCVGHFIREQRSGYASLPEVNPYKIITQLRILNAMIQTQLKAQQLLPVADQFTEQNLRKFSATQNAVATSEGGNNKRRRRKQEEMPRKQKKR